MKSFNWINDINAFSNSDSKFLTSRDEHRPNFCDRNSAKCFRAVIDSPLLSILTCLVIVTVSTVT